MSTFTIPLKKVIEYTGGTVELVNGVSKLTGGNIGLQHYPIFDEAYRDHLTGRIIDHYWNREIGLETVEMFQLGMRRKMNEIMPLYNKLYESERITYDPLSTVDIRTISSGESTQISEGNSTVGNLTDSTARSRAVNSDTPQTMLAGNADYATAAADSNSVSSVEGESTEESLQSSNADTSNDSHTTGYQGVAADLIMRYRDSLLNIDLLVISEVEELFMLVWDNGDSYTRNRGFYL